MTPEPSARFGYMVVASRLHDADAVAELTAPARAVLDSIGGRETDRRRAAGRSAAGVPRCDRWHRTDGARRVGPSACLARGRTDDPGRPPGAQLAAGCARDPCRSAAGRWPWPHRVSVGRGRHRPTGSRRGHRRRRGDPPFPRDTARHRRGTVDVARCEQPRRRCRSSSMGSATRDGGSDPDDRADPYTCRADRRARRAVHPGGRPGPFDRRARGCRCGDERADGARRRARGSRTRRGDGALFRPAR